MKPELDDRVKEGNLGRLAWVLAAAVAVMACVDAKAVVPPPELKVAFIGDAGAREDHAVRVLELIKKEGAEAVIHQGDLDYNHDPAGWDRMIDEVLGEDFPYFVSAGNHDKRRWEDYQRVLEKRARRVGVRWRGQLGVRSILNYRGLSIVSVAPGVFVGEYGDYIRKALARDRSIWRICSWHMNELRMQVGGKWSETGWEVYEEARKAGAIIVTGHEHLYSRTHVLSSVRDQKIASRSDTLAIGPGKTFVVVNGLGGMSMRRLRRLPLDEWWAKVYALDNGSQYGALFGVFHVEGRPDVAEFYFKDIDGRIVDRFTVVSEVAGSSALPAAENGRSGRELEMP